MLAMTLKGITKSQLTSICNYWRRKALKESILTKGNMLSPKDKARMEKQKMDNGLMFKGICHDRKQKAIAKNQSENGETKDK